MGHTCVKDEGNQCYSIHRERASFNYVGRIYEDRLKSLELLPISYWHELYLDLTFFFKAINNLITVSDDVLPPLIIPSRLTRSSANANVVSFRPRKCKTFTYQRSYFNRTTRTWNSFPQHLRLKDLTIYQFKKSLLEYYKNALQMCYNVVDARTWKTKCPKSNSSRPLSQHLMWCR